MPQVQQSILSCNAGLGLFQQGLGMGPSTTTQGPLPGFSQAALHLYSDLSISWVVHKVALLLPPEL